MHRRNGRHDCEAATLAKDELNSIPEGIVWAFLEQWVEDVKQHANGTMLFLDAFAGFGSVGRGVDAFSRARGLDIVYVGNDIVDSRWAQGEQFKVNFEVGGPGQLDALMDAAFAHVRVLRMQRDGFDSGVVQRTRVPVLIWCSTPCETYGKQGRGAHRRLRGEPSAKALKHDQMNLELARWLCRAHH
jgi:hypothetical protein